MDGVTLFCFFFVVSTWMGVGFVGVDVAGVLLILAAAAVNPGALPPHSAGTLYRVWHTTKA